MTDEKTLSYIKKCLDAGRMPEAIETSGITNVALSIEELKNYIHRAFGTLNTQSIDFRKFFIF